MKKFILILLIFIFVSISTAVAENQIIIDDDLWDQLKNSECSSIILQVSDNESVSSFRRDEVSPADIFISNTTLGNLSAMEQYKHRGGYFFQSIITENGWVIGCGGKSDGTVSEEIKNISSKMVLENNISGHIYQIQEILSNYNNGHLVIKDPQGNYAIAYSGSVVEGKLNSGHYICVPNMQSWLDKGTFDSDPVNSSIKIASKDRFGIDRRDIITYHYINNESGSFLDIYATNDDGSFVSTNTGHLADNIDYGDDYILAENIPHTPNKLLIGHYAFRDSSFKFLEWLGF